MFEANNKGPIGVFDSGYGGLTILDGIRKRMPHYNYIYIAEYRCSTPLSSMVYSYFNRLIATPLMSSPLDLLMKGAVWLSVLRIKS